MVPAKRLHIVQERDVIMKNPSTGHHILQDATCEENATCKRCGFEVKGSAMGHLKKGPTCEADEICVRCNKTWGDGLGDGLGHDPDCSNMHKSELLRKVLRKAWRLKRWAQT